MAQIISFLDWQKQQQANKPKKELFDFLHATPQALREYVPEYDILKQNLKFNEMQSRAAAWKFYSENKTLKDIEDPALQYSFREELRPLTRALEYDYGNDRTTYISTGINDQGQFYTHFNTPNEEFFRDNKINSESDMGMQVLKYLQKEAEKERINNVSSDNRNAERIIEKVNNNTQLNKAEKQQVLKLYYDLTEKKVENEIQLREQSSVTAFAMDVEDGYLEALDWVIPFYEIDTGFERYLRTDYYEQKLFGLKFGINSNSVEDIKVRTENLRNDIIQSYSGFRTDFGNVVGAMIFFLPLIILLIIWIRKLTFAIVKKIKRRKR